MFTHSLILWLKVISSFCLSSTVETHMAYISTDKHIHIYIYANIQLSVALAWSGIILAAIEPFTAGCAMSKCKTSCTYKHAHWTSHRCLFDLHLRANRGHSQMKIDMEMLSLMMRLAFNHNVHFSIWLFIYIFALLHNHESNCNMLLVIQMHRISDAHWFQLNKYFNVKIHVN